MESIKKSCFLQSEVQRQFIFHHHITNKLNNFDNTSIINENSNQFGPFSYIKLNLTLKLDQIDPSYFCNFHNFGMALG